MRTRAICACDARSEASVQASEWISQPKWPIYVISLRNATERRARCAETMARLGLWFEFFDAVEGTKLTSNEIARSYDAHKNARLYKHSLSRPEIGCSLSHYELWERISASEQGGAFLLEDDFEAEAGLAEVMAAISHAGLKNCMVKLFARHPTAGEEVSALPGGYRLVMPRHVPGQTVGYAVDSVAAGRLAARAMPMGRPVDMDIKHWWEFDVPVLVVQPSVLKVDLRRTGSSIEAARLRKKPEGQVGAMRRAWRNLRYQFAYNRGVGQHRWRERQHLERLRAALRGES
jgi:glycosyl transferase, family 25